jgi:quercetin dioxygenase-like cupin family protein
MKAIKTVLINALFFVLLLTQSTNLYAQDPMKAAHNVYKKVLLENDKVRVMEVVFAPGTIAPWHSHPNHSVYAVTGGQIQITEKGKPAVTMDVKMGTAMYMPAVTHMAKNTGTTTLKLIVTEMKPSKK